MKVAFPITRILSAVLEFGIIAIAQRAAVAAPVVLPNAMCSESVAGGGVRRSTIDLGRSGLPSL